jgi:nitric oxide synthase-interacting protein
MCEEGHIFCQVRSHTELFEYASEAYTQECVVTSLVSQKKEIKRQTLLLEQMKSEEEQEKQAARQHARERVLAEFEQLQSGKPANRVAGPSAGSAAATNISNTTATTSTVPLGSDRGVKRKFELDDSEVNRLADEQEEKAMKEIEREQAEKRKAKLPNFWLVSPCCWTCSRIRLMSSCSRA